MKKKIITFVILTIIIFCIGYFFNVFTADEMWNYGFSYNIAKGAIPYKDFNMVILPFYPLLMAIPLLLFNHLMVWHLVNAILISLVITIVSDNKKINLIILLLLITSIVNTYGYNTFIMCLLLLIIFLNTKNYKHTNAITGLLLGIIVVTKQNLILLFIPYILLSKNKIKSIMYCFIPIVITLIYLLVTSSLMECIDYCFLGLGNFKDNLYIQSPFFIVIEVMVIIYLVYNYIRKRDVNYLYLLMFQIINYPLLGNYHFSIGIIPVIYYVILTSKVDIVKKVLYIFSVVIFTSSMVSFIGYSYINRNLDIYCKNFPFNYRAYPGSNINNFFLKYTNIVNNNKDKRIFIFSGWTYYMKMATDKKMDKYDLINKGNMGSNEEKYIDELNNICSSKDCLIILANKRFFYNKSAQANKIIRNWVLENYYFCGRMDDDNSLYCRRKK